MRLRDSRVAELIILVLVFALLPWSWQSLLALRADSWHTVAGADGVALTHSGWWLVHVSIPIFQFLLLRWYYRLAIWWRFLWQVSRLPLQLHASHPDRAGGIGFLGESGSGFAGMLFAQGAVVSGLIASRIFWDGHSALEYRAEVGMLAALLLVSVIGPLFFFAGKMVSARRAGWRSYGALAANYGRQFESKWLGNGSAPGEPLLGSADIQSLADISSTTERVQAMKLVPLDRRMALQLIAAVLLPFVPLVFTVIPLTELVSRVVKMLL